MVAALVAIPLLVYINLPSVLAVSRAEGARQTIATAAQARTLMAEGTVTVLALWGNDYWQLAYERAYGERLRSLNVISQRDDMAGVLARGDRLLTLERTVDRRSFAWWEDQLGWPAFFEAPVPGLVEISDRPEYAEAEPDYRFENGVGVDAVEVSWCDRATIWVQLTWIAPWVPIADQRVAVEILHPNQRGEDEEVDVAARVIRNRPVLGHYPVSRWLPAETIRDAYALELEPGVIADTGRLRMYSATTGRATEWLRFDVPPLPDDVEVSDPLCRR